MRIADMDWRMVEDWVRHDDRAVLPIGSTEQHGGLSLATDAILAEHVAVQAAEPLGVPVFPVLPFGLAPGYSAFPGTVTLRLKTFAAVLIDVLDSLKRSGFRRVLLVNGHAGNRPAAAAAQEWMMDNPDARVRVHDWWAAPRVTERISAIDPVVGHASWVENFSGLTRLPSTPAEGGKEAVDMAHARTLPPFELRALLEDGSHGGLRQRDDAEMQQTLDIAVQETRALLDVW